VASSPCDDGEDDGEPRKQALNPRDEPFLIKLPFSQLENPSTEKWDLAGQISAICQKISTAMKTQKKHDRGLCCQTRNKRWKWMAGATAATAAGVTATQASTITINLVGNYISGSGGNHLNADLTGDRQPDLTIANAAYFYTRPSSGFTNLRAFANVDLKGIHAHAYFNGYVFATMTLGSRTAFFNPQVNPTSPGPTYLTGSIPITFKDLHINGGALTTGSLEVTVSVRGAHGPAEIDLDSLTYNTRNNIPDQGSTLALLAMGASGVLALRRWRAADIRS
jgi:hypothetical protein